MPRARDPNRDKAFEIYKQHDGNIPLKDIAEQLGKGEGTVRGWKNKDKWDEHLNGTFQSNEWNAPIKNKAKKKVKKAAEIEEVPLNENGELTDKQWLFCMYYTKYWNATKAYQKVHDSTYATARNEGSKNLAKPCIKDEIERMKEEIASGIMIDGRVVLQKYIDIAFADIGDYVEVSSSGYAAKVRDLENVDTSIITEISNTEEGIKLKLADKMKALDFLAKYTDLLNENEKKRLQEEKLKADIAKVHSETKGDSKANIQTLDMSKLSTEELRAIANSKR